MTRNALTISLPLVSDLGGQLNSLFTPPLVLSDVGLYTSCPAKLLVALPANLLPLSTCFHSLTRFLLMFPVELVDSLLDRFGDLVAFGDVFRS